MDINYFQAKGLLDDEKALLVDVRSPEEFAQTGINGALNIPLPELALKLDQLGSDKDRPIVLYCRTGNRSGQAVTWLQQQGFSRLYNMGSYEVWED